MSKQKHAPRSILIKKLDSEFSKFIRLRYADSNGYASCVTCGAVKHWKEQQCGHYEGRSKMGTRWDEINCNVQCYRCNVAMKGNYPAYARYLTRKHGSDILDILDERTKDPAPSISELEDMIEEYKQKVKILLTNIAEDATM